MNTFKRCTFAVLFGMSVSLFEACATQQHGVDAVNPDSAGALRVPDVKQINRPGTSVRSTVQNPISSAPAFHYQDENGNEITEYREIGQPSEIEVRSRIGTRYQLSEPIDPSQMPTRSLRGVPSVKLTY